MKPLPLFEDVAEPGRQHPIYRMIRDGDYAAERTVLLAWSEGFHDRDGKFCHEFQVSFEPCLWELYLHAYMKELGAVVGFSYATPDFVVSGREAFCIEATICAPAAGQPGPYGHSIEDLPEDLNRFNSEATIRICNSFTSKVKRLRERYAALPQCEGRPFVLAIASFDRPFAHMAGMRPIISALYGLYHDEERTISSGADKIVSYNVDKVVKNQGATIDVGYFCTPEYSDVSAVIFSSVATWGKVRAVADNPNARTVYRTFHPNPGSLLPIVRVSTKADYHEHLLDGLCVMHNPFAKQKLDLKTLGHERLAQGFVKANGELDFVAPDDFLLMRFLMSVGSEGEKGFGVRSTVQTASYCNAAANGDLQGRYGMKACVYERYGSPDVLHLKEVEKPTPKSNEVLIKTHATTVTAGDWRVRSLCVPAGFGLIVRLVFGFSKPRQPILGSELGGVIESVGSDVRKFKVGDPVFAFSDTAMGCHAEYRCMPEDGAVLPKPGNLTYGEAAALSFGGTTALDFFRRAKLQRGERVLVNGASGGVGTAAVQLAKHFGAEVTGVCSTGNVDLVKSLGADHVIDYTKEDFTQTGETYDVIMDTVGTAPFSRSKDSLKAGGRLLLVVAGLPDMLQALWVSMTSGKKVIAGPVTARVEDVRFLAGLAEAGAYKPVIDRCYPFEQIVEAHRYVDTGRKRGNVVITLVNDD